MLIEKLCRENDKLKEDAKVAMLGKPSGRASVLSHKTQTTVAHVSDEIKTIKDKLEEEKLLHERMDDDIKNLQQEIIDQKRRFKGQDGAQERNA